MVGLGLFAAASAVSALAPSVGWLIAARAVQGAGSALIMPLGLALLSAAFPPEKRGAAIGIFSAITGIAVAAGPLVGGAVVEGISWEWIFWINVPIALAAIPLVLTRMRESYGPDTGLDIPGLALVSAGAFGLVWGLVRGNGVGWGSLEVIGSLVVGLVLIGAFVAWELRQRADAADAVLPLALVRGGQRGDLLHLCLAVRGGVLLCPAAADRPRLRPARHRPAAAAVDRDLHQRRPDRRRLADRVGERPLMVGG